jgi:hypothetical protein
MITKVLLPYTHTSKVAKIMQLGDLVVRKNNPHQLGEVIKVNEHKVFVAWESGKSSWLNCSSLIVVY